MRVLVDSEYRVALSLNFMDKYAQRAIVVILVQVYAVMHAARFVTPARSSPISTRCFSHSSSCSGSQRS
jgi:hypothetical protein